MLIWETVAMLTLMLKVTTQTYTVESVYYDHPWDFSKWS